MLHLNFKFFCSVIFTLSAALLCDALPVKDHSNVLDARPGDDLAGHLNKSANPCEDFYEYACGRWTSRNVPKEGYPIWSNWYIIANKIKPKIQRLLTRPDSPGDSEAIRKARRVYRACTNDERIEELGAEPVRSLVRKNGGWPLLMDPEDWRQRNITWQQVHANIIKTMGVEALFALHIGVDPKNSSLHRISITQPSLGLKRKELISENDPKLIMAYKVYLHSVASVIRRPRDLFEIMMYPPFRPFWSDITKLVDFEISLAEIMESEDRENDVDKWYSLMTINELQNLYDSANPKNSRAKIDWLSVIRDVYTLTPEITVDGTEEIIVVGKDYFPRFAALLDRTPDIVIVNFVMWKMIIEASVYTDEELRNYLVAFNNHRVGADPIGSREYDCLMESQMSRAVSYAYVKEYVSAESKEMISEMVENIQQSMKQYIQQSTWMDDATKNLASEKIDAVVKFIGYPDDFNATSVDDYYKDYTPTDNYFENEMRNRQFFIKKVLRNVRKPAEKNTWHIEPTSVNAYYIPLTNSIVLPAGIFQLPILDLNRPSTINYGMMGSTIGHEISHALDSNGRRYDKNGNAVTWWSRQTIERYEEQTQCFINQYNNYTIFANEEKVIHVNGTVTLEENISDSTGLQVTWDAYKLFREKHGNRNGTIRGLEEFTDDQVFFLSFANLWCTYESDKYLQEYSPEDEHGPARVRVNGAVSNVDAFATAFNCPVNSRVNPSRKCNIWKT